ncbi:Ferric oxidoreductase domain-containing protein [Entamoeba marina]
MYYISGDSVKNVANPVVKTWPYGLKSIPFTLWGIFSNRYTLYKFLWFNIREYMFTFLLIIYCILSMIYGYHHMPFWFDYLDSKNGEILLRIAHVLRRPLHGLLVALLLPLPKNNLSLLSIIGTTYPDILMFHRIAAYMGCDLNDMHLTSISLLNGIICFFLVCILLATLFIRRRFYNLFHKIHFIVFIFIVITYIRHCSAYSDTYKYYVYIPLALYGFDLLLRFYYFIIPAQVINKTVTKTGAVVVTFKKNIWYNPTQYLDVLFPSISLVSFHPFSVIIGNFTEVMENLNTSSQDKQYLLGSENVIDETENFQRVKSHRSIMKIVVAPLGKWTQNLKDSRKRTLEKWPMFMCNPVGRPVCPLGNSKHILLIGTGIGFAPMLGYLQALAIDGIHDVDVLSVSKWNDLVIEFTQDFILAKRRIIGTIENYCTAGIEPHPPLNDVVEFKSGRPSFNEIADRYTGMGHVLVCAWGSVGVISAIRGSFKGKKGVMFTIFTEDGRF